MFFFFSRGYPINLVQKPAMNKYDVTYWIEIRELSVEKIFYHSEFTSYLRAKSVEMKQQVVLLVGNFEVLTCHEEDHF